MSLEQKVRPAPLRQRDNEFFWDGAKKEELRIQECNTCKRLQHPPVPMCPECLTTEMGYQVVTGRGKVYSWVAPRYPATPNFKDGFIVALINLDEGVRIISNLCQVDLDSIYTNMKVELFFVNAEDGEKIPQFRPLQP
tara:strand:+ start:128 stop:541 length:414 start_codon:yes stop_codon:yes gene_type:complete